MPHAFLGTQFDPRVLKKTADSQGCNGEGEGLVPQVSFKGQGLPSESLCLWDGHSDCRVWTLIKGVWTQKSYHEIFFYGYLSCRRNWASSLPFSKSPGFLPSIVLHAGPGTWPSFRFGSNPWCRFWFRQDCKPWPGNTCLTIPFGPDQKLRLVPTGRDGEDGRMWKIWDGFVMFVIVFFWCGPVENMSRNSFVPHSCTQLYSFTFLSLYLSTTPMCLEVRKRRQPHGHV